MRRKYDFVGDEAPSRCAAMLDAGECEIALIPVIEYQRIVNLLIIPEVAVAAKNRVRSVLIISRRPLEEVRSLTLDTSSRTSQALVKILFARRYGFQPEFTERAPDAAVGCVNMLEASDAALVIGDPAMKLESLARQLGLWIYDLAEEWRAMTGRPFVFAVWAVREDAVVGEPELARDFIAAKREGVGRREQIATQYATELELPRDELLSYLRDNVNYDLDDENIAGMRLFFDLAQECGLISQSRELRFVRH
jgi:chorismate dehydratase